MTAKAKYAPYFYAIVLLTGLLIYLLNIANQTTSQMQETRIITTNKTKYILYWTRMFNDPDFLLGLGSEVFHECPVRDCFVTSSRTLRKEDEFDAIVFHVPEFNKTIAPPAKRRKEQIYVFANAEPPFHYEENYLRYPKRFFNWTLTYRSDSDVVRAYGRVRRTPTDYRLPTEEEIGKKRKKVAWVASNCNSNSNRESLVNNLIKHVPVDSFGKCGKLECVGRMSFECYQMLAENYMFYLSFENSVCEDYITEKFFHVLEWNLVPVVYGGGNYSFYGPPNSYIDVRDFRSVRELGNYLNYLMSNYEEYVKYFEWKKDYVVTRTSRAAEVLCPMCEKLHNLQRKTEVYEDVARWWRGRHFAKCAHKDQLPPIK